MCPPPHQKKQSPYFLSPRKGKKKKRKKKKKTALRIVLSQFPQTSGEGGKGEEQSSAPSVKGKKVGGKKKMILTSEGRTRSTDPFRKGGNSTILRRDGALLPDWEKKKKKSPPGWQKSTLGDQEKEGEFPVRLVAPTKREERGKSEIGGGWREKPILHAQSRKRNCLAVRENIRKGGGGKKRGRGILSQFGSPFNEYKKGGRGSAAATARSDLPM